jgi:hypothetical protein
VTQPAGVARSWWRARPAAAAHRSKPLPALRSTKLNKVFTSGIMATRGTRFVTLGRQRTAVAAGDGEAVRLASSVDAGKLQCSSSEDEGTNGGGTPARW